MPTGTGFITSATGDTFLARFMVSGQIYDLEGFFTTSIPKFACSNVVIAFSDPEKQFVGRQTMLGQVGRDDFEMKMENGVVLSGSLDMPIFPPCSVEASGTWG